MAGWRESGPPTMSTLTAAIFIFNLVVGTGALALPAAFQKAGWLVASLLLVVLALTSYMTASWVVEAMANCNALLLLDERATQHRIEQEEHEDTTGTSEGGSNYFDDDGSDDEIFLVKQDMSGQVDVTNYGTSSSGTISSVCSLSKQLELAQMADILYNKVGRICFWLCMALYLYGDLAIYCTAVAKSLRDVACTDFTKNSSNYNSSNSGSTDRCWTGIPISRTDAYRIFVGCFVFLLGPFTFFNVTKTKYLQLMTSVLRWTAFTLMVALSIARIINRTVEHGDPPLYNLSAMPAVFGVSVYAFMCHHSIPGLISPVKNKSRLGVTLAADYALIACFYLILSFTGIFAFPSIPDLYTLTFKPARDQADGLLMEVIDYFLTLFPVFTLSTNFPIIAITLRNNLATMLVGLPFKRAGHVVFPLLAVLPSALIALATEDLGILVTITGAYAGAGIQYIIPVSLVWLSRRRLSTFQQEANLTIENPYGSYFARGWWLVLVSVWCTLAIALVTINFILQAVR